MGRAHMGPARFDCLASASGLRRGPSARPGRNSQVGDLVGFCRSPGLRARRWPRPARDGSAASHLEGLVPYMQAGPPPSSRARHGALGRALWQQSRRTCHGNPARPRWGRAERMGVGPGPGRRSPPRAPRGARGATRRRAAETSIASGSPAADLLPVSAVRVAIKPPGDGSFLVHGVYPKTQSNCKHAHRGTLEARYPGRFVRSADDGTMSIVVTLPFERYWKGIAEVPPSWPAAALEAQAVAARSYALSQSDGPAKGRSAPETDLCHDRLPGLRRHPRAAHERLRRWMLRSHRTSGQVLLYGDRPADTVYFSTSNGHTYGNDQVFGSSPLPYLRPVIERDDGASPTAHWRVTLPFRDLATFLQAGGVWPATERIASVRRTGRRRVAGPGASSGDRRWDVPRHGQRWASCLTGAIPDGRVADDDPLRLVRRLVRRQGRDGGRAWLGPRRGDGAMGRLRQGQAGWSADRILAFYYGGLSPTAVSRTWIDPRGRGLRPRVAHRPTVRPARRSTVSRWVDRRCA